MLRALAATLLLAATVFSAACPQPALADVESDLSAAHDVFQRNLDAIRHRDRAGYLQCYLESPGLVVTGAQGFTLGYDPLAASAGSGWPDYFEGVDLRLTSIRPGVVYGTYRYRVRYGADEQTGLSERVFIATEKGWKIAMTSALAAPPRIPAPPRAIVGGTLLDGTGRPAILNAVIVVRDGRIETVGPRSSVRVPAGMDTIDARGRFIVPGLIDTHVHYSQSGWVDSRPDVMNLRARYPYEDTEKRLREHPEVFHRAWLTSDVTTVLDAGGLRGPWRWRARPKRTPKRRTCRRPGRCSRPGTWDPTCPASTSSSICATALRRSRACAT
jgi:hypothetical protein